jgi:PAS domain S-box-containing protein
MIDRALYLEEQISKQRQFWITRVLMLGIILFLSLGIMDYYATPENFIQFLIYRLVISLILAFLCYLNTLKRKKYYQHAIITIVVISSAVIIELMILSFGGHESSYYVGMNLLIIAVLGLIPFDQSLAISLAVIIYAVYIIPILFLDKIFNLSYFITSNFFILSTFSIALTWRILSHRSILNELMLQYDLEEERNKLVNYSGQLEGLVAERTKELSLSEKRYRELFDNANDGIAVIDKDGIIINVNQKFCELHGFERSSLIGLHFELLEAKNREDEKVEWLKRILNGEALVYEVKHYRKDGSTILLEVSSKGIDIGGELYVQSFHRNITEKKQLQEQLLQSQKMESVGLLAGGIAHDFNNILTAILGHTDLLHECTGLDDKARASLRIVENSARKAGQIVSKLLSFSRTANFEIRPVNVNDVIKDAVELCNSMSRNRKVQITMNINKNIPFIHADSNQMEQVLMNLLVNAMDAMPDGGIITISTEFINLERDSHIHLVLNPGRYILMKVTDTGSGIPEEIKDKIFNPFFTTKGHGKGTGLGLAMVYGIIKEHRGIVNVKTKLGEGTTFEIYLPASYTTIHEAIRTPVSLTAKNVNILVVDDEEEVLHYIKRVIEKGGYKSIVTDNPYYALEIFEDIAGNIDLVITDIVMPLLNGRKLLKHFREIKPTVKTIAISGYDVHHKIKDKNIDAFLNKPLEGSELLSTIKRILGLEKLHISKFN